MKHYQNKSKMALSDKTLSKNSNCSVIENSIFPNFICDIKGVYTRILLTLVINSLYSINFRVTSSKNKYCSEHIIRIL